jgi:hypothetical protein
MSQMGQKAKYSIRADVVCCAPNNGHIATTAACPGCSRTWVTPHHANVGDEYQCGSAVGPMPASQVRSEELWRPEEASSVSPHQ